MTARYASYHRLISGILLLILASTLYWLVISIQGSVERSDEAKDRALELSFAYRISEQPENLSDVLHAPFVDAELNSIPPGFSDQ